MITEWITDIRIRFRDEIKTIGVLRKLLDDGLRDHATITMIISGPWNAAAIMKHMTPEEIDTFVFEMSRFDKVSSAEIKIAVEKFIEYYDTENVVINAGIDYAREALQIAIGEEKTTSILDQLNSSLQVKPFSFIRKCDHNQLAFLLKQEHTQVIALILSYMEPNKASAMLSTFDKRIKADVVRRMASMNYVLPEILREIERVLEKKLQHDYDGFIAGGLPSVVELLNLINHEDEKTIIENLEDNDPELADEIKKRLFIFEDITMLHDSAIKKILENVDSQDLARALIGADTMVREKIFKNCSTRSVNMIKEDMLYMSPVRLHDIEETQEKITAIIRKLEDDKVLSLSRCWEDEMVSADVEIENKTEQEPLKLSWWKQWLGRKNG
jgi:flagellar motor switch protein FliG